MAMQSFYILQTCVASPRTDSDVSNDKSLLSFTNFKKVFKASCGVLFSSLRCDRTTCFKRGDACSNTHKPACLFDKCPISLKINCFRCFGYPPLRNICSSWFDSKKRKSTLLTCSCTRLQACPRSVITPTFFPPCEIL